MEIWMKKCGMWVLSERNVCLSASVRFATQVQHEVQGGQDEHGDWWQGAGVIGWERTACSERTGLALLVVVHPPQREHQMDAQ